MGNSNSAKDKRLTNYVTTIEKTKDEGTAQHRAHRQTKRPKRRGECQYTTVNTLPSSGPGEHPSGRVVFFNVRDTNLIEKQVTQPQRLTQERVYSTLIPEFLVVWLITLILTLTLTIFDKMILGKGWRE